VADGQDRAANVSKDAAFASFGRHTCTIDHSHQSLGNRFDPACCNTAEGGEGATTPVGSDMRAASPFGAKDMAGNVWEEWTASLFMPYP